MNFNEEKVPTEEKNTIHLMIFSVTKEFSNESIHLPSIEIAGNSRYLKDLGYVLKVFPNGMREDDIGYVSLMLCHYMNLNNFEGTCIISVMDASGNARFSQSFTFFDEQKNDLLSVQPAVIGKYISRKTLLSDPDDLLPDDKLTLKIQIYVSRNYRFKSHLEIDDFSFSTPSMVYYDKGNAVFRLDSPSGKRLADESSFFRSILDSPMIEGRTNIMHFPEYEFTTFLLLKRFLQNSEIAFNSVKEIFDMYVVADKYDISFLVEFSRCFLKLCLFDHSVEKLLEMTEELEDDILKELIKEQINLISKEYSAEDISTIRLNSFADAALLKKPVYGGFWAYWNSTYWNSMRFFFLKEKSSRIEKFSRIEKSIQNDTYIDENREECLFDFYK